MPQLKAIEAEFTRLKLDVSARAVDRLALYAAELEHWNKRLNLTALQGVNLVRRLIAEPVWVGRTLEMSGVLADVGSGNGSPAIPLSLTRDFSRVHLIEARARRAAFLRHVVSKLSVSNAVVYKNRLDELGDVGRLDWVTFQAVAPTAEYQNDLRRITSPAARIVWITSRKAAPVVNAREVVLPDSDTQIWVFQLDQC